MPGTVIRAYGKFFDVRLRDEPRVLLSTTTGSLRRERRRTDLIAVGDRVWLVDVGEGEGQIESVEPRQRSLARLARLTHDTEQVILANPDQALFLFSMHRPEPHTRMLDRFLVLAESRDLPAMIGINKLDLEDSDWETAVAHARELLGVYEHFYPVFYLSVKERHGIEELRAALEGKVTVFAGPSGVGKSSLLNEIDPHNERAVGQISDATGKGRHTTVATVLHAIGPETFVADTPGIRSLILQGVDPTRLPACFPEFRPYLGRCYYSDCSHLNEESCAVTEAVEQGDIPRQRYESYVSLRQGEVPD